MRNIIVSVCPLEFILFYIESVFSIFLKLRIYFLVLYNETNTL